MTFTLAPSVGIALRHALWNPPALTQGVSADTFLFTVESTGCLPPEKIVSEAGRILISKIDEFSDKVEKGETDDEITDFEPSEQWAPRLEGVGAGDVEEEDEKDAEP